MELIQFQDPFRKRLTVERKGIFCKKDDVSKMFRIRVHAHCGFWVCCYL